MKFGITLRQHSKPAWRCIDYAFLKLIIRAMVKSHRTQSIVEHTSAFPAGAADGSTKNATISALDHSLALVRLLGNELDEWKRRVSSLPPRSRASVVASDGGAAPAPLAGWGAVEIGELNHKLIETILSIDISSIAHSSSVQSYVADQRIAHRTNTATAGRRSSHGSSSDAGTDMDDSSSTHVARNLCAETPVPFISQLMKEIKAANAYFRGLTTRLRQRSLSIGKLKTSAEAASFSECLHDLTNFAVLNVLATLKIVKKHDKVLTWRRPLGALVQRRLYGANFFHFLCAAASAERVGTQSPSHGAAASPASRFAAAQYEASDAEAVRDASDAAPLAETYRYLLRRGAHAEALLADAKHVSGPSSDTTVSPPRPTVSDTISTLTSDEKAGVRPARTATGTRVDPDALAADPMNYLILKILRRGAGGADASRASATNAVAAVSAAARASAVTARAAISAAAAALPAPAAAEPRRMKPLSPMRMHAPMKRPRLYSSDYSNQPQFDLATLSVAAAGGNTADRLAAAVAEHTLTGVDGADTFGGLFGLDAPTSWLEFDQPAAWTGSDGELGDMSGFVATSSTILPLPPPPSRALVSKRPRPGAARSSPRPAGYARAGYAHAAPGARRGGSGSASASASRGSASRASGDGGAAAAAAAHGGGGGGRVRVVRMKRSTFGSIRCGKCNSFGLVEQCRAEACVGSKYYIVCRVARVPKEERNKIARVAYPNWNAANEARIALLAHYGPAKRKRRSSGAQKPAT